MLQSIGELESWHQTSDPWGYETHPDDRKRKHILLSELPVRKYERVLDIGCGQGFITRDLPGEKVTGIDISKEAILKARESSESRLTFRQASIFDLLLPPVQSYDLIIITGLIYQQYVGHASTLIYHIIDTQLAQHGVLVSVHIDQWYQARFPYLMLKEHLYEYREFIHRLEVYEK